MRTPFIAGNWKMHGSRALAQQLITDIARGSKALSQLDIVILPPAIFIPDSQQLLQSTHLQLGAQNLYLGDSGAFTGELSGSMLKEFDCRYVLIGHSERRALFHESLELTAEKFAAALAADLIPILCIGETQAEREQGKTEAILQAQLQAVIDKVPLSKWQQAIIAYEPVWAIGTGQTATPEIAQDQHQRIRQFIAQNNVDLANRIRILYGGSMKPNNAAALLAMPDIDGGLIGGAALDAASFLAICQAAAAQTVL